MSRQACRLIQPSRGTAPGVPPLYSMLAQAQGVAHATLFSRPFFWLAALQELQKGALRDERLCQAVGAGAECGVQLHWCRGAGCREGGSELLPCRMGRGRGRAVCNRCYGGCRGVCWRTPTHG